MYVCICKGITDSDITQAVYEGASSYSDMRNQLGVGSCCGRCTQDAKAVVAQSMLSKTTAEKLASIAYVA